MAIDGSVGGLVWVRRRNGSWWPGRILGIEELSESCLVSPRSGTPVKLLGREDASIDWYNLERSKRVKAFRCGEYDEFIEKAKASAANVSKKAVKYARREDAILQALELENARQGKDHLGFSCSMDASGSERGTSTRNSPPAADSGEVDLTDNVSDSEDRSDSVPELSQSGLSFEENTSSSMVRSAQSQRTPNDSEDDGTEGVKRMRGLEDLGIGVVSKRRVQTRGMVELVQEDNDISCNLNTGNCLTNEHALNNTKVSSSLFKRKRTQVSNAHEFFKRKDRRRPLTKVLEISTMVSVPVSCHELPNSCGSPVGGLSDGRLSGLESNESKKSLSAAVNYNSDSTGVSCENMAPLNVLEASHSNIKVKDNEVSSVPGVAENDTPDHLFDVPFIGEGKNPAGFPRALGSQSSQSSQAELLCASSEIHNESGSTSSAAADPDNNVSKIIEKSSSKWQLKGKRNSRKNKKTRKIDSKKCSRMDDESNTFVGRMEHSDRFTEGSDQKVASSIEGPPSSKTDSLLEPKKVVEDQTNELEWNKCMSQQEELHTIRGETTKVKQLPDDTVAPQRLLPFRQSRFLVHPKYQMPGCSLRKIGLNASLYDVELEVKASYKPQHVPLVSLMSKLNCKAIIGHPLTVEALDDGHCEVLLSRFEFNPQAVGGSSSVQPNSLTRKRLGEHCAFQPHASPRKSSKKKKKKKKAGQLSKKTRKLSSLTGHKHFLDESRPVVVEKSKSSTVIACIPLKVAFSRISEAVNGLARPRPTHRPLISANQ